MRRGAIAGVLLGTALGLVPGAAGAAEPNKLRYNAPLDIGITSFAAAAWVTSEVLKPVLVPEKCRWCYRGPAGESELNAVDRSVREALLWENPKVADTTSSVLGFAVMPVTAMGVMAGAAGHDKALRGTPLDVLLVLEASFIAADVNQIVKFAFARERPFVHFLPRAPDSARALTASPSDDNLSFFSGHTTLAFALATSAGTISSMRDYRLAPAVWAAGLPMAFAVGYLRIAADKHYFTDVLTGAIAGTVIGVGIPLLFHSPSTSTSAADTSATPSAFSVSGAF